jgi:hypothetical protein
MGLPCLYESPDAMYDVGRESQLLSLVSFNKETRVNAFNPFFSL